MNAMLATAPLLTLLALTGSFAETVARLPELPDFTAGLNAFAAVWGAALWRATWQAGLFALVVGLFVHLAGKHVAPRIRATLWWLVAVKAVVALSFVSPIPVPVLPAPVANAITEQEIRANQTISPLTAVLQTGTGSRVKPGPNRVKREASPVRVMPTPATALLCLWAAGVLCHMGLTFRQFRLARALVARAYPVAGVFGANVYAEVSRLAGNLGLNRLPEVRISPEVASPLLVGLSRTPTILLPASLIGSSATALSIEELRLVLAHELAHLKRADPILGILPAFASALFFFHPAVHRTLREFDLAREAACDAAAVAASGVATERYGALLVRLSAAEAGRPRGLITTAVLAVASGFVVLRQRLILLQVVPLAERRSLRSHLLSLFTLGVLTLLGIVPWRMVATPEVIAPPEATVEVESVSESVEAETTQSKSTGHGRQTKSGTASIVSVAALSVARPLSPKPARMVSLATPRPSASVAPLPLVTLVRGSEATPAPVTLALALPDEPAKAEEIAPEEETMVSTAESPESPEQATTVTDSDSGTEVGGDAARDAETAPEADEEFELTVTSESDSLGVATLLSDARFVEANLAEQVTGVVVSSELPEASPVTPEPSVSSKYAAIRGMVGVRDMGRIVSRVRPAVSTVWTISVSPTVPTPDPVAEPNPMTLPTMSEMSGKMIPMTPEDPA